jgi:hypothetical protein
MGIPLSYIPGVGSRAGRNSLLIVKDSERTANVLAFRFLRSLFAIWRLNICERSRSRGSRPPTNLNNITHFISA